MTDFFKNNPMALRHCLLYEYLRKSRVERIFDAFPIVFGDDVIKKEEYQVWFDQFKQGIFDTNDVKKPIADMRDVLRNDKYALRACILYESIKYKQAERVNSTMWPRSSSSVHRCNTTFSIYNNFCNVIGEDVMEFPEFDFWFYRFLNQELDWSFERDMDKKIYELGDMPIDVMENVVEYLDIFDRINLAKTSRSLQTFVGDQKLFHHFLGLKVFTSDANVSFGNRLNIEYDQHGTWSIKRINRRRKTCVEGVSFWKEALRDFIGMLKNPKLYLDTLEIKLMFADSVRGPFGSLKNVLDDLEGALKFTHHLKVKNLSFLERRDQLSRILPSLKPGYLTTIGLISYNPNVDSMNKVFEMEQWKQAKRFSMNENYFVWPLHHLYHFKEFRIRLNELSVEDCRQMKETLFKSPNFEKCSILVYDRENAENAIEEEFGPDNAEYMKVYPIVNSTDYFEIKQEGSNFKITRKKK